MSIELKQLSKRYGKDTALHPTDLTIRQGEMLALLGASGSGKTTLLRLIAGLETADTGSIGIHGRDVTRTPVRKRNIGFVFQHYALFKHLRVIDNITFGLRVLPRAVRPDKKSRRAKAMQLLDMVQLAHLAHRYPAALSGGQQQRVALARALATEPRVILFDEPFGALDVQVRRDLRIWLKTLQKELQFTGIFVTHDQEEALDLADRIAVMQQGRILQTADAPTLYHRPANASVFRFMSDVHEWPAESKSGLIKLTPALNAWLKADNPLPDQRGHIAIRNQELALAEHPAPRIQLPVRVKALQLLGTQYRLTLKTEHWGEAHDWHILLPVQSLHHHLPENGKRYYLVPRQAYFLGENGSVTPLLHDLARRITPPEAPTPLS